MTPLPPNLPHQLVPCPRPPSQNPDLYPHIPPNLQMKPEDEDEEDAGLNMDPQRQSKCVVLKTSTRQTIFLPVVGLVDAKTLKPSDLVGREQGQLPHPGHPALPSTTPGSRPWRCAFSALCKVAAETWPAPSLTVKPVHDVSLFTLMAE